MAVTMRWEPQRILSQVEGAIADGLSDAGHVLLGHSNSLVPIEEGVLQATGVAEVNDKTLRVGYNTPYAYRQHEDLTYNHAPGRTAKYLEKPLRDHGPELAQIVGRAIVGELNNS